MGIIILAAFTVLLIGAVIYANRHTDPAEEEEAGDYNARLNDRLDYIERYIELIRSDHALGKITEDEYRQEMKRLLDELNGIRSSVEIGMDVYKSPEIEDMGKIADDFFSSVGGSKHEQ